MKRRNFLSNLAVGGLTAGAGSGLIPHKKRNSVGSVHRKGKGVDSNPTEPGGAKPYDFFRTGPSHTLKKIGSRTSEEIRQHFQKELFDDTVPYWEKYGVDRQYGGYLKADKIQ